MENIQDERARELCFEALRKQDLIRWGIFITTMKSVLADMLVDSPTGFMSLAFKNVTEKNLLFPIPANEIGINRGLIQNPDWL
ncbi:SusD family protein [compost metagenome]